MGDYYWAPAIRWLLESTGVELVTMDGLRRILGDELPSPKITGALMDEYYGATNSVPMLRKQWQCWLACVQVKDEKIRPVEEVDGSKGAFVAEVGVAGNDLLQSVRGLPASALGCCA